MPFVRGWADDKLSLGWHARRCPPRKVLDLDASALAGRYSDGHWSRPSRLSCVRIPPSQSRGVQIKYFAWRRWPKGGLISAIVGSWISVGLLQALASLANGIHIGDPALGLRYALGMPVMGWVFAGIAIAVGHSRRLSDPRPIALLGGWVLLFSAIATAAWLAGMPYLILETPLSLALPDLDIARFYGPAQFFLVEESFGDATMRLVLFFPWTTGLGLGGIAIALISLRAPDWRLRALGFLGGTVGAVFSWSRTAIVVLVAVLALEALLRLPRWARLVFLGAALTGGYVVAIDGFDPLDAVEKLQQSVENARGGSSMARQLIYEKSWEGFVESPIVGQGWIGESVHPTEHLPIGSHSTVYGLLYTGGLPTFLGFAAALLLTSAAVLWQMLSRPRGADNADLRTALGLCIVLALFAPYESLFSLTIPCLYLFTWIGGALRTT
jgi:hypothetical protein